MMNSGFLRLCGPFTLGDKPTPSLRKVKGSLGGGDLLGNAETRGYARLFVRQHV